MWHGSDWALGSMAFSLVGIICATAILGVFLKYRDTPIIKASGKELSYYLLGGIFLSYFSTFLFVSHPSPTLCGMTRILLGLCFTSIYAAILTKTNRIARIFNNNKNTPQKAKYTSPKSQLLIVNTITLIELLILASWMAASPPKVDHIFPSREENVLVCVGAEDASYLIALIYPFILLLLCTYYAFITRKSPDGFNETKLIGFTCYTTCVIWCAFIPIYLSTNSTFLRTGTLCLSVAINATVALACIFLPKVYVCILRPEKNTREAVMTRSASVLSSGSTFPGSPATEVQGRDYIAYSFGIIEVGESLSTKFL